jgi:uncharacterized membrane protein
LHDVAVAEAFNVSRADPSGADQIDAAHQAMDLEVGPHSVSRPVLRSRLPSIDRSREDGMGFEEAMDAIARGVEILGILTLVLGLAAALVRAGLALVGGQGAEEGYRIVRTVFGRSILLGLEFLVAADIIRTVAVQPSLENVAVLGLIVLIRTFLSFSLEIEIDGRWPWRRAMPVRSGLSTAAPDTSEPGGS